MGCDTGREEVARVAHTNPGRRKGPRIGSDTDREEWSVSLTSHPREEVRADVFFVAAPPQGGGERGRRCHHKAEGGGVALSYLVGDTSREEEGRCRLNPDPGRREGRVFCSYFPQAASVAIRVIMLRWMPKSSSSRADRFDSSDTVWR